MQGNRHESISQAAVNELVKAFQDADFFALDDEYMGAATDLPTYKTSIEIEGQSKMVKDYAGLRVGCRWLEKAEELIDQVVDIISSSGRKLRNTPPKTAASHVLFGGMAAVSCIPGAVPTYFMKLDSASREGYTS